MQDGKLKDVFQSAPPGNLESPYTVFGLPVEVEDVKGFQEMGFQFENPGGSGDVSEMSRDGRTYLATRHIKNGVMAFLAVTNTEEEPMWLPQQARPLRPEGTKEGPGMRQPGPGRFIKKLAQFECVPLRELRKSPEERERVLEWMDKIIEDCNKWLRGQDPHNMDLESLFQLLYEDYQDDPERAEILEFQKDVRDVLMRDIRQRITERRMEVSRRELILDQYEAEEYIEEKFPPEELDNVWRQCAKRPLKEHVKQALTRVYPPEVVQRFFELLVQERILIIERSERDANKKIAEMRNSNMEELKKEMMKIKKLKQEYNEYYCVYKEAEELEAEYQAYMRETGACKVERSTRKQEMSKIKAELEGEIEGYRRRYEKERKSQGELVEKLEEAKECYSDIRDNLKSEEKRLKCERENLSIEVQKVKKLVANQKRRLCELETQMRIKQESKCESED
ncbi:UNVERIFIED_CONTAM: hypothetical protein PYX00_007880 [Menopon gallinae]